LECLTIYVEVFCSGPSDSTRKTPSAAATELAKSKIFLSAVRDIAKASLAKKAESSTENSIISHLLCDDFLCGTIKLQVESDDENWLPFHWAGIVAGGISADDTRAVLEYSEVLGTSPGKPQPCIMPYLRKILTFLS
jgi:hypothetical protein